RSRSWGRCACGPGRTRSSSASSRPPTAWASASPSPPSPPCRCCWWCWPRWAGAGRAAREEPLTMPAHLRSLVLLTALGLVFFFPLVLHPTQVLYSDYSDLLAEHVPAKRFLVRSWRETGEVPLW